MMIQFIEKCIVLETVFPNETFGNDTDIDFWAKKLFNGYNEIKVEY